ncbi:hypothetical protein [Gracilibacillus xinjiangensis]|uniref:Uncharacterized protein n=1 Tax=Gracilibacillus xinjiangensis TaxID=1193282 RepID=A0ABV8WUA4_9BACI
MLNIDQEYEWGDPLIIYFLIGFHYKALYHLPIKDVASGTRLDNTGIDKNLIQLTMNGILKVYITQGETGYYYNQPTITYLNFYK